MEVRGYSKKHKTLDSIADFISAVGWLSVVAGGILVLIGLSSMDDFGIMSIAPGLITVVAGILIVAQGQLVSVIGQIEENTQKTFLLLAQRESEFFSDPKVAGGSEAEGSSSESGNDFNLEIDDSRKSYGMASDVFEKWLRNFRKRHPELSDKSEASIYQEHFLRGDD